MKDPLMADVDATNEEDEILDEIPVFLSKSLNSLYLFQYPTKLQRNVFDNARVVNSSVKPVSEEVKVEFVVDTESDNFDKSKARLIAVAEDGKQQPKNAKITYKAGYMDRLTFNGTKAMGEDVLRYVVGVFVEKEVHLTPLIGMQLLRPALSHYDKQDKRIKSEKKALDEENNEDDLQQVSVKFVRPGMAAKKPQVNRFGNKPADEPWFETFWHPRISTASDMERQKLFCSNQQPNNELSLESERYLKKLLPDAEQSHGIDALLPPRVISKIHLKNMSLTEQLKHILKNTKMMSFKDIMLYLQQNLDEKLTAEKVLRVLPQVGLLLNGNWVPQSEVLYPNGTFSNKNGIPAAVMTRARDYVIFRFSRCTHIYRRQMVIATQLPAEEANEILSSIARLNSEKQWEPLLQPNKDFEQEYPELVQRQELIWRATEQTYIEMDFEKSSKRVRKRSVRDMK